MGPAEGGDPTIRQALLSAVVLGCSAAGMAAQEPAISQKAAVLVQVEVLPSSAVFRRVDGQTAAGAHIDSERIILKANQPGELLVEIWKARNAVTPQAHRDLVVAMPVRLLPDPGGGASGVVSTKVTKALDLASARPGLYTVVVVY